MQAQQRTSRAHIWIGSVLVRSSVNIRNITIPVLSQSEFFSEMFAVVDTVASGSIQNLFEIAKRNGLDCFLDGTFN